MHVLEVEKKWAHSIKKCHRPNGADTYHRYPTILITLLKKEHKCHIPEQRCIPDTLPFYSPCQKKGTRGRSASPPPPEEGWRVPSQGAHWADPQEAPPSSEGTHRPGAELISTPTWPQTIIGSSLGNRQARAMLGKEMGEDMKCSRTTPRDVRRNKCSRTTPRDVRRKSVCKQPQEMWEEISVCEQPQEMWEEKCSRTTPRDVRRYKCLQTTPRDVRRKVFANNKPQEMWKEKCSWRGAKGYTGQKPRMASGSNGGIGHQQQCTHEHIAFIGFAILTVNENSNTDLVLSFLVSQWEPHQTVETRAMPMHVFCLNTLVSIDVQRLVSLCVNKIFRVSLLPKW